MSLRMLLGAAREARRLDALAPPYDTPFQKRIEVQLFYDWHGRAAASAGGFLHFAATILVVSIAGHGWFLLTQKYTHVHISQFDPASWKQFLDDLLEFMLFFIVMPLWGVFALFSGLGWLLARLRRILRGRFDAVLSCLERNLWALSASVPGAYRQTGAFAQAVPRLNTWLALRMPSRRALLLGRWIRTCPWWLVWGCLLLGLGWDLRAAGYQVGDVGALLLMPGLAVLPALVASAGILKTVLSLELQARLLPLWLLPLGLIALFYPGMAFAITGPLPALIWSVAAMLLLLAMVAAQVFAVGAIDPAAQLNPAPFGDLWRGVARLGILLAVWRWARVDGESKSLRPNFWMRRARGPVWALLFRDHVAGNAWMRVLGVQLPVLLILVLAMNVARDTSSDAYQYHPFRVPPTASGEDPLSTYLNTWLKWLLQVHFWNVAACLAVVCAQAFHDRGYDVHAHWLGAEYRTQMFYRLTVFIFSPALFLAFLGAIPVVLFPSNEFWANDISRQSHYTSLEPKISLAPLVPLVLASGCLWGLIALIARSDLIQLKQRVGKAQPAPTSNEAAKVSNTSQSDSLVESCLRKLLDFLLLLCIVWMTISFLILFVIVLSWCVLTWPFVTAACLTALGVQALLSLRREPTEQTLRERLLDATPDAASGPGSRALVTVAKWL
jgi:hypothetical protein